MTTGCTGCQVPAFKSLWMIAASLIYAAMGACVKLAADHGVPVAQITFYHCLISLVAIFAVLRWRGTVLLTPHWRAHLARSFTGVASLITYFSAISLLPLATAITLNYTTPLFVALMLLVAGPCRLHAPVLLALATGFAGWGSCCGRLSARGNGSAWPWRWYRQ